MFQWIKDCLTVQCRIIQRLEDLEENQRINDKMIMLLYKRLKVKNKIIKKDKKITIKDLAGVHPCLKGAYNKNKKMRINRS